MVNSTINPGVPTFEAPLSSAVVQQNFLAAYNDINGILATLSGLGNLSTQSQNNVTITGGSIAGSTINTGSLALSSIVPIANNTVLGNISGISGAPSALNKAQLTSLINTFTSSLAGLVPASGGGTTSFLRADGTFAVPPGGGGSGTVTQVNTGTGLTGGPITGSGTISIANSTADTLAGYNNSGVYSDVTIGSGLSLSGGVLSSTGGGGSGTVTSVSVVSAAGISGTVANPTTTPAITITLGNITPASVNATGLILGSNLSGTNTGDQTTITGNAGTATKLQTARTINGTAFDGSANITITASPATVGNLTDTGTDGITVTGGTGAVIGSGTSIAQAAASATQNGYLTSANFTTFNGKQASGNYITSLMGDVTASGPGASTATLATSGVTAGSYTSANFTVDAKGRITAASNGGGSTVFQTNGTTLTSSTTVNYQSGTNITVSNPSAGNVAYNLSGTVAIANGGTGATTAPAALTNLGIKCGITLVSSGGGVALTAGTINGTTVMRAFTITNWAIEADVSGNVTLDILRNGTSIIGSGTKPSLSSAQSATGTPASWTSVAIAAGDIITGLISSPSTITYVNLVAYGTPA